jgi:hypothetical protein
MNKLGMKETAKWGGKRKQSSLLHFEIYGLTVKEQLCGEWVIIE